ncbi:MAG: AbrB/MazE/SpoVT family DNA-binding domain-containing protein [Candidatus Methanoperedens sp.]|nr:AbrB/MazE/SpoVT family DNA-binding domain-containing protein [Candidatus Methanoperedens sp.]CAG0996719.1 hypothetical protein METP1_02615 [Methanosarcinales archaeon]
MKRKLQKFAGVVGVYIPAEIGKDLHLKHGELVDFSVMDGKIIITPLYTTPI